MIYFSVSFLLALPAYLILLGFVELSWPRLQPTRSFRVQIPQLWLLGLGASVLWIACTVALFMVGNLLFLGASIRPDQEAFLAIISFLPFLPLVGGFQLV